MWQCPGGTLTLPVGHIDCTRPGGAFLLRTPWALVVLHGSLRYTPLALVVSYGTCVGLTRTWPNWRGESCNGGDRERLSLPPCCRSQTSGRSWTPNPPPYGGYGGVQRGPWWIPRGLRGFRGVASEVPLTGPLRESCSLKGPGPRCLVHALASLRLPAGSLRGSSTLGFLLTSEGQQRPC